MNTAQMHFFRDELEKLAGVELNLYGYKDRPEITKDQLKEFDRISAARNKMTTKRYPTESSFTKQVQKKGLMNRLLGRKDSVFDRKGYDAARKGYFDQVTAAHRAHPGVTDDYDYIDSLRTGPRDQTAGKLTSRVLANVISGTNLETDTAYSDTPVRNILSDKDLDKIKSLYQREMKKHDTPETQEFHQKFLNRIDALKKDPSAKMYRLEWG